MSEKHWFIAPYCPSPKRKQQSTELSMEAHAPIIPAHKRSKQQSITGSRPACTTKQTPVFKTVFVLGRGSTRLWSQHSGSRGRRISVESEATLVYKACSSTTKQRNAVLKKKKRSVISFLLGNQPTPKPWHRDLISVINAYMNALSHACPTIT